MVDSNDLTTTDSDWLQRGMLNATQNSIVIICNKDAVKKDKLRKQSTF